MVSNFITINCGTAIVKPLQIPVHVQKIIIEVIQLSRATIPANITISHCLQPDCGQVTADPSQLHQIAIKLITSAFHAVENKLLAIHPELPIIICTGFSEQISRDIAENIGIKGFLMNPVDKTEMADMVRSLLDNAAH